MNKQKYLWYLLAVITVITVGVGLVSCGDDDEDDDNTNSTNIRITQISMNQLSCTDNNHPHKINLGLTSGTRWACCNNEATSPERSGSCRSYHRSLNDILPTWEQAKELDKECKFKWVILNGVKGGLFTGPNGNSIFLPASGYLANGNSYYEGESGWYLLGPYGGYSANRFVFNETGTTLGHIKDNDIKKYILSVRPVYTIK